jgi:Ankyrin repeats (many copies)
MRQYVELVEGLEMRDLSDTGFGKDAAMKGFDMASARSPSSAAQRFDITHWASTNDSKSVRFCLESQGVSPDYRDEAGLTALMRAADRNALQVMRILVDAGADLNATDGDGLTALHYAAVCDHAAAAGLLVTRGADTDLRDEDGATAQDVAGPEALAAIHAAVRGEWVNEHVARSSKAKSTFEALDISISRPALLGAVLTGVLAVSLVARYCSRR